METKIKDEKMNEILKKLRKLQALYEGAKAINSEEEANNAAAKIQHLLTLYNLSIDEIGVEEKKNVIGQENIDGHVYKSIGGRWEFRLYNVICRFNFCRCFIYGRSFKKILLVGEKQNIEMVKWLKDMLSSKYVTLSNKYWNDYKSSSSYIFRPISKDRYQRSFLLGCCSGLERKLTEESERDKKDEELGGKINALMVRKDSELSDYMKSKFGRIGYVNSHDPKFAEAYSNGYAEGRNTSMSKPISGARTAAENLKTLGA